MFTEEEVEEILTKECGVYVQGMLPDSPSVKAGVKKGDTIFSVNGQRINSMMAYSDAVKLNKERLELVVIRNKTQVVELTLDLTEKPDG